MSNRKISQLTAATTVTGPDVVPIVSGGATKKVTLSTLSTFFAAAGPTGPAGQTGAAGASVTGPTGPAGAGETYQSTTAPAVASAGAAWFDTASGRYFVRFDGVWVEIGSNP